MIDISQEMYKENILEHYKSPQNKRAIKGALIERGVNPNCGDVFTLFLVLDEQIIKDVSFDGEGCAISTAGASMLTEELKGKSVEELRRMSEKDIYEMLGVPISSAREKCALLSFKTIKKMI